MKMKLWLLIVVVVTNVNVGRTQCNIISVNSFFYYAQSSSNGLIYQSAISLPSIYGKACDGMFTSPLTTNEITTPTIEAGPLLQIEIYPNPVESNLSIAWKGINLNSLIEIISPLGVKLKSFNRNKNEPISQLDVRDLMTGFYFLHIHSTEKEYQYSIKFLKL